MKFSVYVPLTRHRKGRPAPPNSGGNSRGEANQGHYRGKEAWEKENSNSGQ
jgi:hypothetical protein